jgi:septin family protein
LGINKKKIIKKNHQKKKKNEDENVHPKIYFIQPTNFQKE